VSAELTVIVVSYNTREMTLACLRTLLDSPGGRGARVLLVDNLSSDGSADAVREAFGERVEVVEPGENLGFAAANNLAAERTETEWLLLLNPDTEVKGDAVGELRRFAEANPGRGIYGGRTVFADGSPNPSSCWMRPTPWSALCQALGLTRLRRSRFFNPEQPDAWRARPERVDVVSGCFFLIERDLWERLGGFDEAFFMYGEEADLCLRARALGARPSVTDAAVIVHHGGASEAQRAGKLVRLLGAKRRLASRHWRAAWLARPLGGLWPLTRLAATRALAPASARARELAGVWGEVWRRRGEWLRDP